MDMKISIQNLAINFYEFNEISLLNFHIRISTLIISQLVALMILGKIKRYCVC